MQKTASKYASDESEPNSPSASEGEDVNSDEEPTTNKETISKVKSILGFGDEDSDSGTPKVSDSETDTDMEGDETEDADEEGEPEEVPSIKNGFSKLGGRCCPV